MNTRDQKLCRDQPRRGVTRKLATGLASALWAVAFQASAQALPGLSLYGMPLKGSVAADFTAAAVAAGARTLAPKTTGTLEFDVKQAGVPALERLTVVVKDMRVMSARFDIKSYGQENEALRALLVEKYGVPRAVGAGRQPFPSFAARFAPRGSFEWEFAQAMKLVYSQPALGDPSLTYFDSAPAAATSANPAPRELPLKLDGLREKF